MIDDRNELDNVFETGELTEKQYTDALHECDLIIEQMGADIEKTETWCCDILDMMQTLIAKGLKPIEK